ncbi:MAG: diacylglycerol kinase family lipid kinase [Enhydrobacter sp.]|nr:diacylglycerol kinase family lipid kinase [Enhydrobacter sp.]
MNSAAGSVSGRGDSAARVTAAFAVHGVNAEIQAVKGDRLAACAREFMAERANGEDGDGHALVVAGGDGTISAAAGVLAGTDLPLGILPLGTLNHFAKDLGLPLDVDAAAAVIVAGKTRKVDVAELNGRVFVNNSSVGLYPFMVARRNAHQHRHGVGKMLATLPAMVETLRRASWHRLQVAASGARQTIRTPCIFVGNNCYGVGLNALGSRACLTDGELDVHVVRQQSRLGVVLLPFKIALGIVDPDRDVQSFRSQELEIISRRPRSMRVSLDGEVVRMKTPLRYRTRPGSLRVYCDTPVAPMPSW